MTKLNQIIKNGVIRKNAKSKINMILDLSTSITIEEYKLSVDDSFHAGKEVETTINRFWTFYDKHYKTLNIEVKEKDGAIYKVEFQSNKFYHADVVSLYFDSNNSYLFTSEEKKILKQAEDIISSKIKKTTCFASPNITKDFVLNHLVHNEREVFSVLLLDQQHRLISVEDLFFGSVNSATVIPREVVKVALLKNASAVILAHNHPSGLPTPSEADKNITRRINNALQLIEVRVLDHIIAGVNGSYSFAEHNISMQ